VHVLALARPSGSTTISQRPYNAQYHWQGLEVLVMIENEMARLESQRRRQQAAQPAIDTKTCSFQRDRSLGTAGQTSLNNESLSFAGPREYRWQGLEVPAMMGKRRGAARIATASLGVCATSYRHENLLFSQLARSLCTAGET
jgi:hypothetical protein